MGALLDMSMKNSFKKFEKCTCFHTQNYKVLEIALNPILMLLHASGLDTFYHQRKSSNANRIKIFMGKLPMYLCNLVVVLNFIYMSLVIALQNDWKIGSARWMFFGFDACLRIAILKRKRNLLFILRLLSNLPGDSLTPRYLKKINCHCFILVAVTSFLSFVLPIIHASMGKASSSSSNELHLPPNIYSTIILYFFRLMAVIYLIIQLNFLSAFVLYYSHICRVLKRIMNHLCIGLKKQEDISLNVCFYEDVAAVVEVIDGVFCFPTFLSILTATLHLFMMGYSLFRYDTESLIMNGLSGIYNLFRSIGLMIAAISVTEAGQRWRNHLRKMQSSDLKWMQRPNFQLSDINLTVWKIYPIDRSLLVSGVGAFLTYSVLFTTLGTIKQ